MFSFFFCLNSELVYVVCTVEVVSLDHLAIRMSLSV